MGKVARPILFDADAVIHLLEWNYYHKVCRKLGELACVAEIVARQQIKYHTDRATNRHMPFDSRSITRASVPRLVTVEDLTDDGYAEYHQHLKALVGAHIGERETFALAWVLGYDVCSWDADARVFFYQHRPKGCRSEYLGILDLLRKLGLCT